MVCTNGESGRLAKSRLIQNAFEDISCDLGVMFAIKESHLKSAKRFPSQQNSLESVKCP